MQRSIYPAILLLPVLLALGSVPALQPQLILDRDAVLQGQIWRLFTGHFVHLGTGHLSLNLLAFLAIFAWAWRLDRLPAALWFMFICGPALGLLLVAGGAAWYAGLSGLLHGVLVLLILQMPARLRLLGLVAVLAKLVWQYLAGGESLVMDSSIPVSQLSHWAGVALALVFHHVHSRIRGRRA